MKHLLAAILATLGFSLPAAAQQVTPPFTWGSAVVCAYNQSLPTITTGHFGYAQCDANGRLLSTATFSGSVSFTGFTPTPAYATLASITTTSSRAALPSGNVVVAYNTGSNNAYCTLGSNTVSATTGNDQIPPNSWFAYTVGSNTYIACITSVNTTTVNLSGGTGLPTGAGGGGGGSGAGGSVTQGTVPWVVSNAGTFATQLTGATNNINNVSGTVSLPTGASTLTAQNTGNSTLSSILTALGSPFQTSGNIGNTGFNALQGGVANAVGNPFYVAPATGATFATSLASLPALTAGTAVIGKTTIDQTTPGTTNNVTLSDASGNAAQVDAATHALKADIVAGSVSASFSGYGPAGYVTPMSVTSTTSRTALPTNTGTVVVYNVGSNNAYVTIGDGSVNATVSNDVVFPNCWISYAVGTAVDIAAITSSSTTTLNLSGGAGLPAGGCAAVLTGASTVTANQGTAGGAAWPVSLSSLPALATGSNTIGSISNISGTVSLPAGASTSVNQTTEITALGTINTTLGSPMQNSGGSITANAGNDLNTSLLATEATLGSVMSAPATPQTVAVTVQGNASGIAVPVTGTFWQTTQPVSIASLPALPTGSNTIGAVTQASGPWTTNLTQVGGSSVTVGQKAMTASIPVVLSSDQSALSATQSGTWNITNISGTVSLPTGAATSTGQSTEHTDLGTIATNQTNLTGTKNAGIAAANSQLVGSVYNSTPLTLTNGQQASLQGDANGYLKVNVAAGAASGGTSSNFGSAFPTPGTAAGAEALTSAPTWTNGNMAPLWVTTGGALVMDMVAGGNLATAMSNGVTQDNHAFTQGTSYDISFGCLYATAYSAVSATGNLTVPQCDQYGRIQVTGAGASGSAVAGYPVLVAGSDGTNARNVATDTSGRVKTDLFGNAGATLDVAASGATSATNAVQVAGQYLSPQPTLSSGQSGVLQVDANGNLKVNIQTGAGSGGTAITDNSAFTQGTTSETPVGCLYKSAYTNATSGNSTVVRCAADGGIFVTPDSASQWGIFTLGSASGSIGVQPAIGVNGNARNPTGLTPGTAQTGTIYAANIDLTSVNGTAVTTGAGVATSAQRTVVAQDTTTIAGSAPGTAGSASPNVVTVQGVANGTVLNSNVAQINGVTTLMGNGVTGTGSQRVTIASDNTAFGVKITDGTNTGTVKAASTAAIATDTAVVVAQSPNGRDPCSYGTKVNVAIASASGTTQLVAPSGSTQVYICSEFIVGAAAWVGNIVGGTGASCTTGTPLALQGSTTAANGMSFAANGGFVFGDGSSSITKTTTAGHGVCLIQSGTVALAGNITYVQQ